MKEFESDYMKDKERKITLPKPQIWDIDPTPIIGMDKMIKAEQLYDALSFKYKNMSIKFKLIKEEQSIFGQYRAILLTETTLRRDVSNSPGNFTLILNQGDEFTVDFMNLSDNHAVGEIVETDGYILSSYAKNQAKGMVIIIAKSVRKAHIQAI